MPWIFPIVAYLIGSIPFGVLISRSRGVDITQHGSGNVGATNVFRVVGKGFGILCLLLDFLKGFVPVVLVTNLIRVQGGSPPLSVPILWDLAEPYPTSQQLMIHTVQVVTALSAILGHNYSIFLKFGGGKGIATSAGVLTALMPLVLLGMLVVFVLTLLISGYVSLGSIFGALSLPIFRHLEDRLRHVDGDPANPTLWDSGTWNKPLFAFAVVACALALWRHRSNIQRILAGTEDRIRDKAKDLT